MSFQRIVNNPAVTYWTIKFSVSRMRYAVFVAAFLCDSKTDHGGPRSKHAADHRNQVCDHAHLDTRSRDILQEPTTEFAVPTPSSTTPNSVAQARANAIQLVPRSPRSPQMSRPTNSDT